MAERYQQGEYDDVKDGPISVENRQCRDVLCCLLFLINVVVMVVLAIYGYSKGDTSNIYRATDNDGNICGLANSPTANYPFSYFYNPTTNDLSNRICVKQCPYFNSGTLTTVLCYTNTKTTDCNYDVIVQQDGSYSTGTSPTTSDFIGYETFGVIDRVCIPTARVLENAFRDYSTSISNNLRQAGVANFITDLQTNWQWLLVSVGIAIVLSFLIMYCFRCFAGCFVWLSIIAILLLFIAMGIIFLYNGGAISRDSFIGNLGVQIPTLPDNQYYNIFGYISFGLAGVFLILVLCCCGRLRLAVAVCQLAGQFISDVCQIMIMPVFMGLLIIVLWVACIFAMVGLIGGADFVVDGNDVFTSLDNYTNNYLVMFYYYLFATLWSNAFLQALAVFVVACCCAMWYFSHGINEELDSPVRKSFWIGLRFHTGSLAFGAFVLALVEWIQAMVQIFNKQVSGCIEGEGNCCSDCCLNFLRCCIECIKRCVQCINRNAYIQIAIRGKGFCGAAYDAVSTILTNPLRYAIVSGLGWILMLLAKLLIAGGTTFIFYLIITFPTDIKSNVQEPIYLLILVFIVAFAIATVFMAIFSISMETLLACFIFDEQGNGKAKYGPRKLTDLMDKN